MEASSQRPHLKRWSDFRFQPSRPHVSGKETESQAAPARASFSSKRSHLGPALQPNSTPIGKVPGGII